MQEKLKTASYSEQIQVFTLVLDKWSQMYCSEYFNVFEYLVWTSHEIKKVGDILAKPAPKKGKTITISVGRAQKRKTMLVWVKEYINKNFASDKKLCNLQELYAAFKEKHPNVNIGFSKFCA